MAERKGITRYLYLVADRKSAQQAAAAMEQTLKDAAAKGGKEWASELRAALEKTKAQLRQQFQSGEIGAKQYQQRLEQLARTYNTELAQGIRKARDEGRLTDTEMVKLSKRFQSVRDAGVSGFNKITASIKGMVAGAAAAFLSYRAVGFLKESLDAANDLEASYRKLAATSKITGTDLGFLEDAAKQVNDQFRLGPSLANDLTIELAKLATKAGDVAQATPGMAAFLDLGAARGLDAAATLKAVQQAILGIDEGTDKLFGKNPSVLYKEFADQFGLVAGKMTDAEKAQALLHAAITDGGKVRGEYQRWLESAAGQQFLFNQEILQAKQRIGQELQPVILDALPSLVRFVEAFGKLAAFLVQISATPLNNLTKLLETITNPGKAISDEINRAVDVWRERLKSPRSAAWLPGYKPPPREAPGEPPKLNELPPEWVPPPKPPAPKGDTGPKETPEQRDKREWEEIDRRIAAGWSSEGARQGLRGTQPDTRTAVERLWERDPNDLQILDTPFFNPGLAEKPAQEAADAFVGPWEEAMVRVEEIFTQEGGIIADLATAFAEGGLKGLARYALGKVKQNLAAAIEMGAMALGRLVFGDPVGASLAGKSAAGHTAAAAAWKIAAAGMGGGGSTTASGAAALGGAGNAGGGVAQRAQPAGAEIHLHLDSEGFDAINPRVQSVVYGAYQEASKRAGPNANVFIHRRRG
jgi:hypothetical protein